MHHMLRQRRGAWTQGKGRNDAYAGAGVAGDPEPGDLGGATQLQTEFVELDVRQLESTEEPVMQGG